MGNKAIWTISACLLCLTGCMLNTPPEASFTVTPSSGSLNTLFAVDASKCSDRQEGVDFLLVRWDWEDDGIWDTTFSANKVTEHKYNVLGEKTIRLQVKDGLSLTSTTIRQITVANTSPVASFTVAPQSVGLDTPFSVDASGCSDIEDVITSLEVRWDWEDDGTWDTNYSTTKTAQYQYSTLGVKTICLEVKDTPGLTDATTQQVTVLVNTPPVASFTVTPEVGYWDTVFSFDASGCSDAEEDTSLLMVRWDWQDNGKWDTGISRLKTAEHVFSTTGIVTIRLEVWDNGGMSDTTTGQVEVRP